MAKPNVPDLATLTSAGFDPVTGLPKKFIDGAVSSSKEDIKRILRVIDEQDHISSFQWYNLPDGLDGDMIERILYYRGRGMFFYFEPEDKFYFLPFTLSGNIDVYGRYKGVTPLPFNGAANGKDEPWINGLIYTPQYDIQTNDMTWADYTGKCVLLYDYCRQYSQTVIPRQQLNEPLLDIEAECIPYAQTCLLNGTGVRAMRVGDQSEQSNVDAAARTMKSSALNQKPIIAITGQLDFQDLTNGSSLNAEQYIQTMQSFDNFRLQTHGLANGGLFQKSSYLNNTQTNVSMGSCSSVLQDKIRQRQTFANILNSIWGLGVWAEPTEQAIEGDRNMDGAIINEEINMQNEKEEMNDVGSSEQ